MKKEKIIGIIIGIILFICLAGGLSYAWLSWKSSNTAIGGSAECFDINYLSRKEIGTSDNALQLLLVNSYSESEYAELSLALDSECTNIHGLASIYLNTNSEETDNSIFSGALKYAVYNIYSNGAGTEKISEGTITSASKTKLADNIIVNSTTAEIYRIYIWIDGETADNTYANLRYSGYISAEAVSSDTSLVRAKRYLEMTPQEKAQYDVELASTWFNTERTKELNSETTNTAYSAWITNMGGSFPTCASSSSDDMIECFEDDGNVDGADSFTLGSDVLTAIGLNDKGINFNSYYTMAFINESTNKICVTFKLMKQYNSYYGGSADEELDYITYSTDNEYPYIFKSSGC